MRAETARCVAHIVGAGVAIRADNRLTRLAGAIAAKVAHGARVAVVAENAGIDVFDDTGARSVADR
jgi:hypothetical protein